MVPPSPSRPDVSLNREGIYGIVTVFEISILRTTLADQPTLCDISCLPSVLLANLWRTHRNCICTLTDRLELHRRA